MAKVHKGICKNRIRGKSLAKRIVRAQYYWPTLVADAITYVKKCDQYLRYHNFHQAPPEELTVITIPGPFHWWGIDIMGLFPLASGKIKFLIVAINYFTKWIEAEALATSRLPGPRSFSKNMSWTGLAPLTPSSLIMAPNSPTKISRS